MILLSILLVSLLLAVIAVIVGIAFGYTKTKFIRTVVSLCTVVAILSGSVCLGIGCTYNNKVNTLKAEFNDLTLYQPLVEETSNEYIRYDFYDKVNDYNQRYENVANFAENAWFGALVNANWSNGFGPISFYLHGGAYGDS